MTPSGAEDDALFLLQRLIILRGVLNRPERSLCVCRLITVKFVLAYRPRLKIGFVLGLYHPFLEAFSSVYVSEALILLEQFNFLSLLNLLLLDIQFFLPGFLLLVLLVLQLLVLLLLHQVLEDAHLAEYVPLLTDHWLDHSLVADGAHVEGFL